MNTIQKSRRAFLATAGIVTAGAAFWHFIPGIFDDLVHNELEQAWQNICRQNNGKPYRQEIKNKKEIIACKGHEHKEGKPVYFSKEKTIAQPIWIYWAGNANKPSDVIVHFYKEDHIVISANQFDLKLLSEMQRSPQTYGQGPLEAFLKVNDKGQRLLITQTSIGENNKVVMQPLRPVDKVFMT